MSVTGSSSTSTAAASDRLAKAMSAAHEPGVSGGSSAPVAPTDTPTKSTTKGAKAAPKAETLEEGIIATPAPTTTKRGERTSGTTSSRDASRGAKAAPGYDATAAEYADQGAQNVQSVSPGADTTAYSPYEASTDSYEAQANAAYDTAGSGQVQGAGSGGWNDRWQKRFEALQLAPADIAYLASGGFDDATLEAIAGELEGVPVLDPSRPEAGRDAGSAASANGPTAAAVAGGQPGLDPAAAGGDPAAAGGSAWNPDWEKKFGDLMQRMGMSDTEIQSQLQGVKNQPTTEAQLQEAYRQMESSVGAWNDTWKGKFDKILDELKTPAKDKEQVMQQLSGGGMTEAQLQEAYDKMVAAKPAWGSEWESKFKALEVPEEMLKQLKDSGAPKDVLEEQYKKLLDTKMEYLKDGRLEKLQDADASAEEKWGVMLQGTKGEDFDKVVEQIHSAHVPAWKRIGSFALNLIPGAYAVQYLVGKDLLTGEKIDRSNPLNIVGAVASGFAGFTAIRSAVAGVQGLTAANAAAQATKAAAGGAALADAVTGTSALGRGSFQAMEAAGLVAKFDKGLKFTDYLKSAIPIVNRFGEAGRLSSFGRGYTQAMQLAAGSAALRSVEGGGMVIDKATKATVLDGLKQGQSIDDALAAAGRSGRAGGFAVDAGNVARDYNRFGFLQGNVSGKFGIGNGSGNFTLNPFKNTNTISNAAGSNVFNLGRGVNFGSAGGLAQGLGAVRGANMVSNAGLATQAAARAAEANSLVTNSGRMAGNISGLGGIENGLQRVTTLEKTAEWAQKLGVSNGGRFRTLFQLGSNRAATNAVRIVENGGSGVYRTARFAGDMAGRWAGMAALPIVGGAAVGMTGRQMQPGWEYLKHRDEIQAEEHKAAENADKEAAELERLYAEQHGGSGGGGATDAAEGAGTSSANTGAGTATGGGGAATGPQVVGTSPTTGGQLVFDPSLGAVYDATNGDVYDPNTGQLVGNLSQLQGQAQGAQTQATTTQPQAGTASTTGGGGGGSQPQVYVDPATGYYVDPTTGLMADPATGNVYDPRSGQVVGNVNQPAA
jgi:hypothetical protein